MNAGYVGGTAELTALDRQLARFLGRLAAETAPVLSTVLSRLRQAVQTGQVGLDLSNEPALCTVLRQLPVVGVPGTLRPLLLDDTGRLYLYRHGCAEQRLVADVRRRRQDEPLLAAPERLRAALAQQFPTGVIPAAVAAILLQNLAVLPLLPDSTALALSALTLLAGQGGERALQVVLAAPNMAAAQRLQDSVRRIHAAGTLGAQERQMLPERVQTLEQLLGQGAEGARSRHHRDNPLPLDVLLISETDSADLAVLIRLLEALPARARLILLGDPAQPGAVQGVFAALAATDGTTTIPQERLALLAVHGIAESSPPTTALALLAAAVCRGEWATVRQLLHTEQPTLHRQPLSAATGAALLAAMQPYHAAIAAGCEPATALAAFTRCGIFCAEADGVWGSVAVNRWLENALAAGRGLWYPGRPVRIVCSDRYLRLYRGDLGLVLPDPQVGRRLRVFFPTLDGWRRLPPTRLPPHETAYAVAVSDTYNLHCEQVIALLPATATLAREHLYTLIARARAGVALWGDELTLVTVLRRSLARPVELATARVSDLSAEECHER